MQTSDSTDDESATEADTNVDNNATASGSGTAPDLQVQEEVVKPEGENSQDEEEANDEDHFENAQVPAGDAEGTGSDGNENEGDAQNNDGNEEEGTDDDQAVHENLAAGAPGPGDDDSGSDSGSDHPGPKIPTPKHRSLPREESTPIPQPTPFESPTPPAQLSNSSLQAILASLATAISDRDNSGDVKGTSVRSPDKFSGKDRTKFRTFIAQLKLVFRANPRRYGTDTNKVTYACSYLDDNAFAWYENFVTQEVEPDWFSDFAAFEHELSVQFGTINAAAVAERKMGTLRMRPNEHINDYLTKFTSLKNDVDWNDSALSFAFRSGLPNRIKDEIARHDSRPRNLQELTELVIRIDFQYWDRETERYQERTDERPTQRHDPTSHRTPSSARPTTRSSTAPRSTASSSTSNSMSYRPNKTVVERPPLPLDNQGKVTNNERQRRIDNKLCLYCGGNHFLDKCDKKKPGTVARIATSNNNSTRYIVGGEDETNYDSDSGNE